MNDGGFRLRKYGVVALALGLYAGVSAWIVAGEGVSYREKIALKSIPTHAAPVDPVDHPESVEKPVTLLARGPEPSPPAIDPPQPSVDPKEQSPRPKAGDTPKKGAPTKAATPAKAAPPPVDHFWDEPDQLKVWDLEHLTDDDESELGLALNQMVLHDHPKISGGALRKRLIDAGKAYEKTVTRKNVKYTYTVLDCPRMNVFSHPGGYIYVCKGLFDWIPEDKDYALEFIIAHEMRHVDQKHAITCLKSPSVKKLKLGTVSMFYAVMIPAGYYPEEMDLEADHWAAEQMLKAGRSRLQTLAFLRRLEDYAKANKFEDERKSPIDEPRVPLLDNHIRAHPTPSDRLDELKTLIDRLLKI